MTPEKLQQALHDFAAAKAFQGKGALSVALVVTRHAFKAGLPLDAETLVTNKGGQVLGLGRGAVQAILKRHGIARVLASEGGRTSRGSLGNMRDYVAFLNRLHDAGPLDFAAVETFWIDRVRAFFAAKPFKLRLDASQSLRAVVRDVLAQAVERQKTAPGTNYAGAVLQHLVGAKLDCVLGVGKIKHHSVSTADAPSQRAGDFLVGDAAIHVTTAPGEAVIARCKDNLERNQRPLLVTWQRGLAVAEGLAENAGLAARIDLFEIEQFIALNLHEWSRFGTESRKTAVADLIDRYNTIVGQVETDPSLKIEWL